MKVYVALVSPVVGCKVINFERKVMRLKCHGHLFAEPFQRLIDVSFDEE
jgi:hypothetical protein